MIKTKTGHNKADVSQFCFHKLVDLRVLMVYLIISLNVNWPINKYIDHWSQFIAYKIVTMFIHS